MWLVLTSSPASGETLRPFSKVVSLVATTLRDSTQSACMACSPKPRRLPPSSSIQPCSSWSTPLWHPNYLLSANLAINVHPGETAQALHCDDGYCRLPRPRDAMGISAIWAIDDFTDDNGATELIPGSHTWGDEKPDPCDERAVQVTMPAGSVCVFMGTLLHRGGANRSNGTRLGITPQYCQPWIRQIENMTLAVPPRWPRPSRRSCDRFSATASILRSSGTSTDATLGAS